MDHLHYWKFEEKTTAFSEDSISIRSSYLFIFSLELASHFFFSDSLIFLIFEQLQVTIFEL